MTLNENPLILPESRPNRADAVKNRELLLETAQELFAAFGVEAVSMTQISQAAGVGKGTLYRHFSNKSQLCHALLDHDMRDLQERTLRRLRQQPDTPQDNLQWFLAQVIHFVYRNHELLDTSNEPELISTLEFPAHVWWRQTIRGLLERLPLEGDLDYMTDALYVMLDANTIRYQQARGYHLERITRGMHDLLARLTAQA